MCLSQLNQKRAVLINRLREFFNQKAPARILPASPALIYPAAPLRSKPDSNSRPLSRIVVDPSRCCENPISRGQSGAGPMVRIQFPPAESPVRTRRRSKAKHRPLIPPGKRQARVREQLSAVRSGG